MHYENAESAIVWSTPPVRAPKGQVLLLVVNKFTSNLYTSKLYKSIIQVIEGQFNLQIHN